MKYLVKSKLALGFFLLLSSSSWATEDSCDNIWTSLLKSSAQSDAAVNFFTGTSTNPLVDVATMMDPVATLRTTGAIHAAQGNFLQAADDLSRANAMETPLPTLSELVGGGGASRHSSTSETPAQPSPSDSEPADVSQERPKAKSSVKAKASAKAKAEVDLDNLDRVTGPDLFEKRYKKYKITDDFRILKQMKEGETRAFLTRDSQWTWHLVEGKISKIDRDSIWVGDKWVLKEEILYMTVDPVGETKK